MKISLLDTIENRIMIPFLVLLVIPIFAIGSMSLWSTAQHHKQLVIKEAEERLTSSGAMLDLLHNMIVTGILEEDNAQEIALHSLVHNQSIYIYDEQGRGLYAARDGMYDPGRISKGQRGIVDLDGGHRFYQVNQYVYDTFSPWDWQVGTVVSIDWFSGLLLEIQKYTLLIAIIAALLTIQATVILSHNLSRPLKKMAKMCNDVNLETHELEAEEELRKINRNDEIGALSKSFIEMLTRLKENNQKLLELSSHMDSILQSTSMGNLSWQYASGAVTLNKRGNLILQSENITTQKDNNPALSYLLNLCRQVYLYQKENQEERSFTINGETIILEIIVSPLLDGKGEVVGATSSFQDITARRKVEEQIERLDRLVFLGEMSAGLAHEIRNPLAGMKTCAQVIRNNYDLDDEGHRLAISIENEIDRINDLIINMLKFSTASELNMQGISLNQITKETVNIVQKQIKDKGLTISLLLSTDDLTIVADKNHIKQILLNLLLNAIDAANTTITVQTAALNNKAVISIADDGPGIAQENLKKIFNPFFTTKNEGTGMGLAVVLKLVNLNSSSIEVISNHPQGGATFITYFEIYSH